MSLAVIDEQYLSNTADAIREKTGDTALLRPSEFADAISSISGGGGSTTLKFGVLRPDAELVKSYQYDKLIHEDERVTIPSYSTSSVTLKASENLTSYTMDFTNYDYIVLFRYLGIPVYSITTTGKGRCEYNASTLIYEIVHFSSGEYSALVDPTKKTVIEGTTVQTYAITGRQIYYSSATNLGVMSSSSYGVTCSPTTPTVSESTLSLKSPALNIRGSTSYFSSTYFNALTDVRYQWIIDVYRAKKGNLNIDGFGLYSHLGHIVDCAGSSSHKLT